MTTPHPALHRLGCAGLGLLLSASVTPTLAQDYSYFYGGLSAGQSRAHIDEARITAGLLGAGLSSSSLSTDEKDTGYRLFAGYQFNRYFGLEAGAFTLGKFGFVANTTPAGTLNGDVRFKGLNLDLVATVPLTQNLSLIGRAGVQRAKADAHFSGSGAVTVLDPDFTQRATEPKLGIGLQYEVSRSFLLRAELERYRVNDAVGNRGDVNLVSVGLVFPFGRTPAAAPQRSSAPAVPAPAPMIAAAPPPPPTPEYVPPPAPLPPPQPRRVSFSADSLFSFDVADIRPEGRAALDTFSNELKGTSYERITVEGHTDRLGSAAYNDKLSTRRAETVKAYLVRAGGIDANKVSVVGKGESEPVTQAADCPGNRASPKLIACLQADRRVEVEVTGTR